MEEQSRLAFKWAVPESQFEAQRAALVARGAEVRPEPEPFVPPEDETEDYAHAFFEPLLLLVGVIAVVKLAEGIVEVIKDASTAPLGWA